MMRITLTLALVAAEIYTQQPTFRSGTEMVRIDALVEQNGIPVSGLTSDSFAVLDAGKPQRIVTLKRTDAVTVGVALDTSGSMKGDRFERASKATLALLDQLHADEPSVVVGFAATVSRLIPVGTPASDRPRLLQGSVTDDATGLGDGAYAAVLACDNGPGSKLVVLLSDGRNNESWLSATDVIDAARRHEVVIYAVAVDVDERSRSSVEGRQGDDAFTLLQTIAGQTGGRAIRAAWSDDLSAAFRGILDEYRQRYIIAFVPEGVSKGDGWHTLTVTLKHGAKGQVHARAGYWSR